MIEKVIHPENQIVLMNGQTLACFQKKMNDAAKKNDMQELTETVQKAETADRIKEVRSCDATKEDRPMTFDTMGKYLAIGRGGLRKSKRKLIKRRKAKQVTAESEETRRARELFVENAFVFYNHTQEIMHDSRLFLTPVPIQNELAYFGTSGMANPTLGVYAEWWSNHDYTLFHEADAEPELLYQISGSPLSGSNVCKCVNATGISRELSVRQFHELWRSLVAINVRYNDAKGKYEHYSLEEALNILKGRNVEADDAME